MNRNVSECVFSGDSEGGRVVGVPKRITREMCTGALLATQHVYATLCVDRSLPYGRGSVVATLGNSTMPSRKTEPDERMMRRCIELAMQAGSKGNTAVGSLVVVNGDIIAEAEEQPAPGHRNLSRTSFATTWPRSAWKKASSATDRE